jgi:hypothetical protein
MSESAAATHHLFFSYLPVPMTDRASRTNWCMRPIAYAATTKMSAMSGVIRDSSIGDEMF